MTNDELRAFFSTHQWFDNSKLRIIRGRHRKAFFALYGPTGTPLATTVGDGANFGTATHAALQRYYNGWGKFDEPTRRVHAHRAFAETWGEFFPTERMQSKHRLDNGLDLLTAYFDQYLDEDALFEPIEAELGFAHRIEDFWYVGRADGIFRRISDDTHWLRETKTCSKEPEKRLKQLKFDNQPVSYLTCLREQQPNIRLDGYLGDVIFVGASRKNCRGYFRVEQQQSRDWRAQLINTVIRWRGLIDQYEQTNDINVFDQDTERCFDYGQCSFYELCDYGITPESLSQFEPDSWHPLISHTPAKVTID